MGALGLAWGGGVGGGGVHFQEVQFFNYFRHNKSEPDLTDDCIFTVFLICLPNWFRLEMEPHELVRKSVTTNLHSCVVNIFKLFLGPVTRGHVQEFTALF